VSLLCSGCYGASSLVSFLCVEICGVYIEEEWIENWSCALLFFFRLFLTIRLRSTFLLTCELRSIALISPAQLCLRTLLISPTYISPRLSCIRTIQSLILCFCKREKGPYLLDRCLTVLVSHHSQRCTLFMHGTSFVQLSRAGLPSYLADYFFLFIDWLVKCNI
jgi:hypothetical protein